MISINSKKIKLGNRLECVNQLGSLLLVGKEYEIIFIGKEDIKFLDEDNDITIPLSLPLDKDCHNSLFKYFKIW